MALIETTHEEAPAAQPRTVLLELWPEAAELLDRLTARTGFDASELVAWALGAYWREMEGIVLPPPELVSNEDVERMLRESEADFEAGRTSTNDEVFARIAAKHGW